MTSTPRPAVVAHADWGLRPRKRWMCLARRAGRAYRIDAPGRVEDAGGLVDRLCREAGRGGVLVGFDFPIGLPAAYARRAGIRDFVAWLPSLGRGRWSAFHELARTADEISAYRPFYPHRPGGTSRAHLVRALGMTDYADLLRCCDRATDRHGAACALFWTLGAKQVGRGALAGWREVIAPALADAPERVGLWPFHGELGELLNARRCTIVETYPAEACAHLGIGAPGRTWSKRRQADRAAVAGPLLDWATLRGVAIDGALEDWIRDGFGPKADGEDPFDAVVGLMSMVEVVLRGRADVPADEAVRRVEGWIFGRTVSSA